jgi:hypothetical protein
MNLTIQPLTGNESESDADRQREAELRRNGKRLRRGQSRPCHTRDWCASVLHAAWLSIERHVCVVLLLQCRTHASSVMNSRHQVHFDNHIVKIR